MPIFKVTIERDVTVTDRFVRFVEAPDAAAAEAKGEEIASASNMDCPDDVEERGFVSAANFSVLSTWPAAEGDYEAADVLPLEGE